MAEKEPSASVRAAVQLVPKDVLVEVRGAGLVVVKTQRCGPRTIAIPSPTPAAFKLTVKQTELNQLLAGSTTHILAWGGSRSGKSFTRARAIVIRAMRVAGSRHLIARYRFNHVVQSIWHDTLPKVMATCSPNVVVAGQGLVVLARVGRRVGSASCRALAVNYS